MTYGTDFTIGMFESYYDINTFNFTKYMEMKPPLEYNIKL